ncbi:MAG: hypothetical protein Q9221_002627, partial [Calogaya cf. arnoldii]
MAAVFNLTNAARIFKDRLTQDDIEDLFGGLEEADGRFYLIGWYNLGDPTRRRAAVGSSN